MKRFLLLLTALLGLWPGLSNGQTRYKSFTQADGSYVVRKESKPGSNVFDVVVDHLPSDAARARVGGRTLLPYAPEDPAVFNPDQFGSDKYYSPSFSFDIDFNPGGLTPAQRKRQGVNRFGQLTVTEAEKAAMAYGDSRLYMTESTLYGPGEGRTNYEYSLAEFEANTYARMPSAGSGADAGAKYVVLNVETSLYWSRASYTDAEWSAGAKNKTIVSERTGQIITLEQLDNSGQWAAEQNVRLMNRAILTMQIVRKKAAQPGIQVSWGASMFQGVPDQYTVDGGGVFLDGIADVSHIGGDGLGNIPLNGRSYVIHGAIWDNEDYMQDYFYNFVFEIDPADYNDIWVNHTPGTQTYPYLWSKIHTEHVVAREKGHIQANWQRMMSRQGNKRGMVRQNEPLYEGDRAGYVNGLGYVATRVPFANLQNTFYGTLTPKIAIPPYDMYSTYAVTRFMAGNEANWGYYLFPENDGNRIREALSTQPYFQRHMHNYTALFQARADMQPYEAWYTGSTLVENPEVQINQSGAWQALTGVQSYSLSAGSQHTQAPAYILRYKATADGWRVVILGGMNQSYTTERVDIVRVPGGGLNGNQFRVKLRGPAAQIYDFTVKSSDQNQVYEALPVAVTSWEAAGYAGRVGANAGQGASGGTTTGGGSTTTTTTTSTLPVTATTGINSRYTYSTDHGGTLQIRGNGSDNSTGYTLKIERADGGTLSLSNAQNSSLPTGVALGFGPSGDTGYPMDWTFWGVTGNTAVKLTFAKNGVSDVVTWTPTVGANQGLTSAATTSTTVTQPPSQTYTPGVTTNTLAGDFDWTPLPAQSIPSGGKLVRETAGVQMKFDLNMGNGRTGLNGLAGGIEWLRDKQTGINNIGNPKFAVGNGDDHGFALGSYDLGSGLQLALYRDPFGNWSRPDMANLPNIGDDPLAYGSREGASSKLNVWGSATTNGIPTDYFQIDAAQWDGKTQADGLGLRFGDTFENWNRLEGNVLKIWYQTTINRNSSNGGNIAQDDPANQEMPCVYTNGLLDRWVFYRGDAPYTNASVENITLPDNSGFGQGRVFVSENWMANINSQTGRGIGLIAATPEMRWGQFGSKYNNNDATGFGRGYINWGPKQILDNGIYRHSVIIVTGTVDEIRAAAYQYTQNRRTLMPEVRFNRPGRQNWWFKNVDDGGWQANPSYWTVKWKTSDAHINSPAGAYDGATRKQFSMRYRYTIANSGNPQVRVWYQPIRTADNFRPGNDQGADAQAAWDLKYPAGTAIDPALFSKLFTLNGDGQWHTVTFDMSDMANWNRIISEIAIWPGGPSDVGEQIQIEWISGSSTGPAN